VTDHEERTLRCLRRRLKSGQGALTLREVRAIVGMTDREGDKALQSLKRKGLIKYVPLMRGWIACSQMPCKPEGGSDGG